MSDWSAKLNKPVYPRDRAPLYTLADAQAYLAELPRRIARSRSWRYTRACMLRAAEAGSGTAVALATEALKLAVCRQDHADLMPLKAIAPRRNALRRMRR